jgi:hypothetical protein
MIDISTCLNGTWWKGLGRQNRDAATLGLFLRQPKNIEQCNTRGGSLPGYIKIHLRVQRNQ